MSWLSELRWSNRLEHLYAMIAGDAELDETVPSTYDRKQGFLYKIAEKIQGGSLPDASEASEGDVLTIDDGEPVWAAASGGAGGAFVVTGAFNSGSTTAGTVDKTDAEISAAVAAGQVPAFSLAYSGVTQTLFNGIFVDDGNGGFALIYTTSTGQTISVANGTFELQNSNG